MPSITLTFTTDHATRIAAAYGKKLSLEGPATVADVKAALVAEIRSVVRGVEAEEAHRAVVIPADVELT